MSKCTYNAPQVLIIKYLIDVLQCLQEEQFAMSFSYVSQWQMQQIIKEKWKENTQRSNSNFSAILNYSIVLNVIFLDMFLQPLWHKTSWKGLGQQGTCPGCGHRRIGHLEETWKQHAGSYGRHQLPNSERGITGEAQKMTI